MRPLNDISEDLSHDILRNEGQTTIDKNKIPSSPRVLVEIHGNNIWSLVDSGSQITAISDTFHNKLKNSVSLQELPVSNIIVSTAIGKKSTNIKKQIFSQIKIGNENLSVTFLIVPYLSTEIILGNDFNLKQGIITDYWKMQLRIKNEIIPSNLVLFERGSLEKVMLTEKRRKPVFTF